MPSRPLDQEQIEQYWKSYLDTLPEYLPESHVYLASQFGDQPDLANELGDLIQKGLKTATCSSLWEWEAEGSELPKVGIKTMVLDGNNQPLCIIETIEVFIRPFNQIDSQFAYEEGEGDCSLEFWREAHWQYFQRVLPTISQEPTPEMLLVCERFRVIYRSAES